MKLVQVTLRDQADRNNQGKPTEPLTDADYDWAVAKFGRGTVWRSSRESAHRTQVIEFLRKTSRWDTKQVLVTPAWDLLRVMDDHGGALNQRPTVQYFAR